jgi:hypothetical protein
MALEVLTEIKAAEEAALETRRVAAAAAKDSIKLAEQENAAYKRADDFRSEGAQRPRLPKRSIGQAAAGGAA